MLGEGGAFEAVQVEHAVALAGFVEEGDDQFGEVAGVAGDIVGAEVADIVDEEGAFLEQGLAAGAVEADGAAGGLVAGGAEDHLVGAFVQSLRWEVERSELVLVQNREPGLLYRLAFMRLEGSSPVIIDLDEPLDELEGYLDLGNGLVLMVSATPPGKPNASFFQVR